MLYTMIEDSPVGPLTIASEGGRIRRLEFRRLDVGDNSDAKVSAEDRSILEQALSELEMYFRGGLREFTVAVDLCGPAFHRKVWQHLTTIPYGQVQRYSEIACALGNPGAARAVGNACAKNPVAVIVPCHRVLAQNGLGGFGGGLPAKKWLLRHEGYPVSETL